MKNVLKFVKGMSAKELFDTYVEMFFEYMQRRSGTDNDTFEEIVEQSNDEEMVTEFKTIFQSAKEEGIGLGIEQGIGLGIEQGIELGEEKTIQKAIKGLITTTDLSDRAIAAALDVVEDLVKKIRQELENEKK